jgi:hypothetical protein
MFVQVGLAFMLTAVAISHAQILCHLRNYTEPLFQVGRSKGGGGQSDRGQVGGTPPLTIPLPTSRQPPEKTTQRYIIRIIYMVPVYAVGSWCSLKWPNGSVFFDTIRDW